MSRVESGIDLSLYADFFVAYGRVMLRIQRAEHTLKCLLLCFNLNEVPGEGLIDDETFDRLVEAPWNKAMSQVFKALAVKFPFLNILFTQEKQEYYDWLVSVRNKLAHAYLAKMEKNWEMIENPDARQLIIAELDEYAHEFEAFNEDWNNLLEGVLERMGFKGFTINDDDTGRKLFQQQYLEDIRNELLTKN